MTTFRVRIHNGNGFSGGNWEEEKRNFSWNNERGGCCFGRKKQGIRFLLWKLWKWLVIIWGLYALPLPDS